MNLRNEDLEIFAKLRIPPQLIEQAGIARVTDAEARDIYGIKGGGDMCGIAFPYFAPETMANGRRRHYVRIRRDFPEIQDGKQKRKYVSPYGDRKHFYFPPVPELLADFNIPIVLVEAEKSVLALTAWSERTGRKILALGLGGVYGWVGKIGIKETPTGERVPEHGPIPDLNVCGDGRKVYVLLDANCATNGQVQRARAALVRQLQKKGADVVILDLPLGAWNGPDDYVAAAGDDALKELFEGAGEGAKILDEAECFLRRFIVMSDAQFKATTLWCAHTHGFEAAIWTPYLAITSAEKRCAKSRSLETVSYLVRSPWQTSSATAASLFREIDKKRPTLLLDELDALFKGDREMSEMVRAVLNAGAHHKGTVARVVGKGTEMATKNFRAFCPKALAGIGRLPDTVADRSIPIRLKRKLHSEKVERLRERFIEPQAAQLRAKLAKWVTEKLHVLRAAEPDIPQELNDRQQDGAECLLAIADAAGGDWPEKARAALVELYTGESSEDQSLPAKLLSDIRDIFERTRAEKLSTKELLEQLVSIEHGLWTEYHQGKPLGARALGSLLGNFGIGPRSTRRGIDTFKGYSRDMFIEAWQRYCPAIPANYPSQATQANIYADETHFSDPSHEASVTDEESVDSPINMLVVTNVTDKSEGEADTQDEDLELSCEVHGRHRRWWIRIVADGGETVCGHCEPNPEAA